MKILLHIFFILFSTASFAQLPKSGTYVYDYCDEEYNKCIGKCKVIIKGSKIWVYAPANLTGIKEGELYASGMLYKHASGKWIIIHNKKDKLTKTVGGCEGPVWINFKQKRFWTC
jgi:hypothetical protein